MVMAAARIPETMMARLPPVRGRYAAGADLAGRNWFRVGGPAEVLFQPRGAEELGDFERSNCYRNFIEQGSDHILPLQITSNSDSFALGGFLGSQSSSTMRVDRNQHAVMALMDAHSLGILE